MTTLAQKLQSAWLQLDRDILASVNTAIQRFDQATGLQPYEIEICLSSYNRPDGSICYEVDAVNSNFSSPI